MTDEEMKVDKVEEKKLADAKAAEAKKLADVNAVQKAHDVNHTSKEASLARVAKIPTPNPGVARARANKELKKVTMKGIHDQIVKILNEFDNKESEIPLNNGYWALVNQYRGMR